MEAGGKTCNVRKKAKKANTWKGLLPCLSFFCRLLFGGLVHCVLWCCCLIGVEKEASFRFHDLLRMSFADAKFSVCTRNSLFPRNFQNSHQPFPLCSKKNPFFPFIIHRQDKLTADRHSHTSRHTDRQPATHTHSHKQTHSHTLTQTTPERCLLGVVETIRESKSMASPSIVGHLVLIKKKTGKDGSIFNITKDTCSFGRLDCFASFFKGGGSG